MDFTTDSIFSVPQETIFGLSLTVAGIMVVSLVVLVVLLIALIILSRSHTSKTLQDAGAVPHKGHHKPPDDKSLWAKQDAAKTKGAKDPAHIFTQGPLASRSAKSEYLDAENSVGKVIDLQEAQSHPDERAKRFSALADTALKNGRLGEARDLFQQCLVIADENDLKDAAALARFELGNLAKAHGDLMAACEHWQLARVYYEELGERKKVRELDAIMADAQCPTDWVLNKF